MCMCVCVCGCVCVFVCVFVSGVGVCGGGGLLVTVAGERFFFTAVWKELYIFFWLVCQYKIIARIAKRCPENISLVVNMLSCVY